MVGAAVAEARLAVGSAEDVDTVLTLVLEMGDQISHVFVLGGPWSDVGTIAVQRGLVVGSELLSGPIHQSRL